MKSRPCDVLAQRTHFRGEFHHLFCLLCCTAYQSHDQARIKRRRYFPPPAHIMVWNILLAFSVISVSDLPLPSPNELSLSISAHDVSSLVSLPSFGGDSGAHHRFIHPTGFGISISGPVWCQTSDHCCPGMLEGIILTSSL